MVHPLAGNPSAFSQWQYISGLKSWQDKEKLPPSEGAMSSLEPEPMIPNFNQMSWLSMTNLNQTS
jgi:hypothetical protein